MISFSGLLAPFPPASISWRVGATNGDKTKGLALAYIDARDVMKRLDEVVGQCNWQDEYTETAKGRVICRIGICVGPGEWVWKSDGAGDSDVEADKGAISDAFKRAAVKWGVGRYLYDMPQTWVQIEQRGKTSIIVKGEFARLEDIAARAFEGSGKVRSADTGRMVNPGSSSQLKKNGAWDSFTDSLQHFADSRDAVGLRAWFASDAVQERIAGWPESWRDAAHDEFEKALEAAEKK